MHDPENTRSPRHGLRSEDIAAALRGPIRPVRIGLLYRASLLLVALAMLLLPLAYLALVAWLAYGLYWHATENLWLLEGRGSAKGKLFTYLTPLVIGGIAVLFLLKPLLARRGTAPPARGLRREDEPLLFELVERICAAVGAAAPSRIQIDHLVNASAARDLRGRWGIRSSGLVLTIGMPLAAGLTLPQLAGVLAHEFGHFAQRAGMGLGDAIFRVNRWFHRVVHERDAWDERLVRWSEENPVGAIRLLLLTARGLVWLSRRVLWVLMRIGVGISAFQSRQMEFDADRYETRLVGSETFARTMQKIALLSVGHARALEQTQTAWSEQARLADDLAALTLAEARSLPDEVRRRVVGSHLATKTGALDTHPAPSERIRSANAEGPDGVFDLQAPASVVFADFDGLCRAATVDFYRSVLGDEFSEERLAPTAEITAIHAGRDERDRALTRVSQGLYHYRRPPFPRAGYAEPRGADDPESRRAQLRSRLEAARERLLREGPRWRRVIEEVEQAQDRVDAWEAIGVLRRTGVPAALMRMASPGTSLKELERIASDEALPAIRERTPVVEEAVAAVAERFEIALALAVADLASPGPSADADGARPHAAALEALAALARGFDAFTALDRSLEVAEPLLDDLGDDDRGKKHLAELGRFAESWVRDLTALHKALGEDAIDPFARPGEESRLRALITPVEGTASNDLDRVARLANHARHTYGTICARLFQELSMQVEALEEGLGLPRLPEPQAVDEEPTAD